jgi:hypoxanthine phosphoribosyltransferase
MHLDIERVLIDTDRIAARVADLARDIAADFEGMRTDAAEEPRIVLIPVLTGSIVFVADLIRKLPLKISLEVVGVSSYPGKSIASKGAALTSELPANLAGAHVLIVDDILDSGQTLEVLTRLVSTRGPASVRTCVLLRKPGKAKADVRADYVGFDIPDEFVVGYGLDYDGYYRNYPAIATLRPDAR